MSILPDRDDASLSLRIGNDHPFDARNVVEHSRDWAYRAARGVMAELTSRNLDLTGIDGDIRIEIVRQVAEVIRIAREEDERDGRPGNP